MPDFQSPVNTPDAAYTIWIIPTYRNLSLLYDFHLLYHSLKLGSPKTRIWEKVVYLRGGTRKLQPRVGEVIQEGKEANIGGINTTTVGISVSVPLGSSGDCTDPASLSSCLSGVGMEAFILHLLSILQELFLGVSETPALHSWRKPSDGESQVCSLRIYHYTREWGRLRGCG